jgi:hypothetical protein
MAYNIPSHIALRPKIAAAASSGVACKSPADGRGLAEDDLERDQVGRSEMPVLLNGLDNSKTELRWPSWHAALETVEIPTGDKSPAPAASD